MSEVKDRYVSFENIDCYKNVVEVLNSMEELFLLHPESKNKFWESFFEKIPENYGEEYIKEGHKDILYLVCSNVFYISDLFEEFDFEKGIILLDRAELECC